MTVEKTIIREEYDAETQALLDNGENVLLLAPETGWNTAIEGTFQPDFWAYGSKWKRRQAPPGILGLRIDDNHPLFESFPTNKYSNWQWWHLTNHSHPVVLDDLPDDYQPIIQVVDNIDRNQKLGLLFEGFVSDGQLLVCAVDPRTIDDDPAAEQLLANLIKYINSETFEPSYSISERQAAKLLRR